MAANKYKGKSLSLKVGSTEYNADLTSVVLTNEASEDDATTFADLAAGGAVQWYFEVSGVSDYGTGSLWKYLWENAGNTAVAFTFAPYGNETPSATQPHFTGTLSLGSKPPVGGTANEVFTFESRWDVDGEPTMVTTSGGA